MHIITVKRLEEAARKYRETAAEIGAWVRIVRAARWRNSAELRATFPDADLVDGLVVFNIRHNRYRLITAVHFARVIGGRLTSGHVYIGMFLTHREYDHWCKLSAKKRAEWPQS